MYYLNNIMFMLLITKLSYEIYIHKIKKQKHKIRIPCYQIILFEIKLILNNFTHKININKMFVVSFSSIFYFVYIYFIT